jgi:hypothetical protein
MRYIVKASKLNEYETLVFPFRYTVYDGDSFKKAKQVFLEYAQFTGVSFESRL